METGLMVLIAFVAFVAVSVGIVVGFLIGKSSFRSRDTQGTIYVYCGEAESSPSLLLDCSVPIDEITSRKIAMFNVDVIH